MVNPLRSVEWNLKSMLMSWYGTIFTAKIWPWRRGILGLPATILMIYWTLTAGQSTLPIFTDFTNFCHPVMRRHYLRISGGKMCFWFMRRFAICLSSREARGSAAVCPSLITRTGTIPRSRMDAEHPTAISIAPTQVLIILPQSPTSAPSGGARADHARWPLVTLSVPPL